MIQKSAQKQQLKYLKKIEELKITQKQLEIIDKSEGGRNFYVYQLLLDQFLAPIESAEQKIQNTAKYAQYYAEALAYHHHDHDLNQDDARIVSSELRSLAIEVTKAESLYELKIVYEAITSFVDLLAPYQHKERKYSISRNIRKNILDPLNDCIASHQNFQRRLDSYNDFNS
jgi:hypothetical protein